MNYSFQPNKLVTIDSVLSGILVIYKSKGITSHDVVNKVRKILGTKRVGHAGTLDPFASGVLIILVGKATKLSNSLIEKDKTYLADYLFGISTDTLDPEGKVTKVAKAKKVSEQQLVRAVESLNTLKNQYVPVYSSTRFEGEKLRVLARKYADFKISTENNTKKVYFYNKSGELKKTIPLPKKDISIYDAELVDYRNLNVSFTDMANDYKFPLYFRTMNKKLFVDSSLKGKLHTVNTFLSVRVRLSCSKGTFVRSLGPYLSDKIFGDDFPVTTLDLARDKAGKYSLKDAITIEQFAEQHE